MQSAGGGIGHMACGMIQIRAEVYDLSPYLYHYTRYVPYSTTGGLFFCLLYSRNCLF